MTTANPYRGKRATVMGLGTRAGGAGVARFLARAGASVTVTDLRPAAELRDALATLDGLPVTLRLGGHDPADFGPEGADLVVRNPAVRRRAPLLEAARASGVPVEMEMSIFFRLCPAPVVGVTGTKGKTTVATLIGDLLRAWDPTTVLAGNMGISALEQLERTGPATPVVIELSSWQLEGLAEHRMAPRVAVLTNISEDHLNTYDGFADYAATKRSIAAHQSAADWLVVNRDDPEAWRASGETKARVVPFGLRDPGGDGAWLAGDELVWRAAGAEERYPRPAGDALAGAHNAANALAALAAARLRGAPPAAVRRGLAGYRGVPDRMERVATVGGVAYVNDTTATAPVAAAAALAALGAVPGRTVHLLCGGASKGLDPSSLVAAAARVRPRPYLLDGTATADLGERLRAAGVEPAGVYASMDAALAAAASAAVPGDVVILSPGCASFGIFRDEFDRGEQFRRWALARAAEESAR